MQSKDVGSRRAREQFCVTNKMLQRRKYVIPSIPDGGGLSAFKSGNVATVLEVVAMAEGRGLWIEKGGGLRNVG